MQSFKLQDARLQACQNIGARISQHDQNLRFSEFPNIICFKMLPGYRGPPVYIFIIFLYYSITTERQRVNIFYTVHPTE